MPPSTKHSFHLIFIKTLFDKDNYQIIKARVRELNDPFQIIDIAKLKTILKQSLAFESP